MERPERPRRHKSIVHRQAPRMLRPRSTSPRYPFEVYESDSDTDITEVGTTLTSSHTQNKRPRQHCIVSVPSNVRTNFYSSSSSLFQQPLMPAPIPIAGSSQGDPCVIPIKTENTSTVTNRRVGEVGPSTSATSYSARATSAAAGSSATSPNVSRILQEINEACYSYPPRPRLTGRRRLHNSTSRPNNGVQNDPLDCSGFNNPLLASSNSSIFLATESPLSPPPEESRHVLADEDADHISLRVSYDRSMFEAPTYESGNEASTVMCQIMMNADDTQQRSDDSRIGPFVPYLFRSGRYGHPLLPMSQNRSPSPPPQESTHAATTVSRASPLLEVHSFNSPQSAFSPSTPLTTPPSSPTNDNARNNENQTNESGIFVATGLYGEASEEDNISVIGLCGEMSEEDMISNEVQAFASHPSNEVIVLDHTPDVQNTNDNQTTNNHSVLPDVIDTGEEPLLVQTERAGSPHTPPLPLPSTPSAKSSEKPQKNKHSPLETLNKLNQNLVSLLECPVCLDFMVPPIFQCSRGHLVCTSCRPKLSTCPSCRSKFADRNLAMEKVAEKLMYPCKNVVTGCKVTMKLKDKAKHEKNCGFRHFDCIVSSCEWKGYKPELIVHLSLAHDEKLVIGNEKQVVVSYMSAHSSWIFYAFEEVFLLTIIADEQKMPFVHKKFCCCMQLIGAPEKVSQFIYTIKLYRSDPFLSIEFHSQTHSDEVTPLHLFYINKGIKLDCSFVKQFGMVSNHRRIMVNISVKRASD